MSMIEPVGHRVLRAASPAVVARSGGSVIGAGHTLRPSIVFSPHELHVIVGSGAALYAVHLSSMPEHTVTLTPSHLPLGLRITPALHVFTSLNWATPQWFRVAAVANADDTSNERSKIHGVSLQTIEHACSSRDPRFHGHRPLLVPATLKVHVRPRDGAFVFASGLMVATATATTISKTSASPSASASRYGFRLIEDSVQEAAQSNRRPSCVATTTTNSLTARSSLVVASQQTPPTAGNAAAIAAVDAANSAVAKRLASTRRSVVTESVSTESPEASAPGFFAPPPKDAQNFVRVACSKTQTLMLQRNGSILSLGKTTHALDSSSYTSCSSEDLMLSTMVVDVACGDDHVVAITEHGSLLTWGDATEGRLGHGRGADATPHSSKPTPQPPRQLQALLHKRIVQVACGARHSLALSDDGDVFAWGFGHSGALGLATSEQSLTQVESVGSPVEVLLLKHTGVAQIACGDLHSAALLTNGTLLTCGWAANGRLGRPTADADCSSCFVPVELQGQRGTSVACGGSHTLVVTADRGVVAFGFNTSGQLGVGDIRDRWTPTRIPFFDDDHHLIVTSVAAGTYHSFATTADAQVFAWGSDELGQCGVGSFPQRYTVPHLVTSALGWGVIQVACGNGHSVLLAQSSPRIEAALKTTQPTRYAQLMEQYERCVHDDKTRRARVLRVATQRGESRARSARLRKPPLGPTFPRGFRWQQQLQDATIKANELIANATPVNCHLPVSRRPQTASTLTASGTRRAMVRPATGGVRTCVAGKPLEEKPTKVRCSSATLWRQTRLFTFQSPPGEPVDATSPTSRAVIRPASHRLKLTPHARQTLGRIFHGDGDSSQYVKHDEDVVKAEEKAALFSATRPKSASSRAVGTTVRAS